MRRIILLVLAVSFITITASSSLQASSPVINHQTSAISMMFARYFIFFAKTFDVRNGDAILIDAGGDDPLVGGDADDYANGKGDPDDKGDAELDILPPVTTEKNIMH